ncbi:MAG: hypothetical protein PWQ57_1021 [Desulfovibrionales bacterium]|nr:hypothetical protein [Desulfovibrionales bacterium]
MRFLIFSMSCILLAGCGPAMQKIPVSSNPGGAQVYADGAPACAAPCVVELSKDQDHILTFRLDGYRQTDVPIKRQYQTMQVLRNSAASGINAAGMMGGTAQGGAANALMNMAYQEESGEAYVLTPTTVTVDLAPTSGAAVKKGETSKAQQAVVKGTGAPVMGEDLQQQDASAVAKEVLATGAAVGAAATPSVTAKTGSSHEHTSESVSPSGTYTKKTTSTSTSVKASVNPAGAALGAMELIEQLTKDEGSPEKSE